MNRSTAHRLPLQAKLVAWVLLLVLGVLAATLLVSQLVLRDRAADRIAQELEGEVAELRLLADRGLDPATGKAFTDVESLVRLHLGSSLPDPGETMFALVDGALVARSDDLPAVRLDLDDAFLATVSAARTTEYGTWPSEAGAIRYAIVPVRAESGSSGAYVVAVMGSPEAQAIGQAGALTVAVAGVLLIPAALASWLLAGRALSPLRAMRTTAREISESDLTGRIVPAHPDGSPLRDELDDLATTFNDMLDRLEASFRAQRQFVDDAGHELRTPLTVVKGHLELLDDDPAARVETLALVDDELDRMGQLVADLQTLTKSTQPAFLNFGPVDLGQLVGEVTARARPLADRRWADEGGPAHEILADRHRLVQALLQLVDNAVTHTDPGARIAVGARADDDQVTLWVTDTGPGVPAELRDHLFDRFVHDSDRSGSGLGLSIVAAIARAHGGYAALLDPGPGGTRFGLVLPMRRPDVTPEEP